MKQFDPTTPAAEARALTVGCLQAIAAGWPVMFFKISNTVGLDGKQAAAEPDIPAMIAAAADMAAAITHAAAQRLPLDQE
jgi:hypothetical protein